MKKLNLKDYDVKIVYVILIILAFILFLLPAEKIEYFLANDFVNWIRMTFNLLTISIIRISAIIIGCDFLVLVIAKLFKIF